MNEARDLLRTQHNVPSERIPASLKRQAEAAVLTAVGPALPHLSLCRNSSRACGGKNVCVQSPALNVHLPTGLSLCLHVCPELLSVGQTAGAAGLPPNVPHAKLAPDFKPHLWRLPAVQICASESRFPHLQNRDSNAHLMGMAGGPKYMVQCMTGGGET